MALAEIGSLSSVQAQAGFVGVVAASLTALIAKGLEIIYQQRKNKDDVSLSRARSLSEEEDNYRKQLREDLNLERAESKRWRDDSHKMREENLRLRGAIQVLALKLTEFGVDLTELGVESVNEEPD